MNGFAAREELAEDHSIGEHEDYRKVEKLGLTKIYLDEVAHLITLEQVGDTSILRNVVDDYLSFFRDFFWLCIPPGLVAGVSAFLFLAVRMPFLGAKDKWRRLGKWRLSR